MLKIHIAIFHVNWLINQVTRWTTTYVASAHPDGLPKEPGVKRHYKSGHTDIKNNRNKKVNNGTLKEREQAKIEDVRKRNPKLSEGKFSAQTWVNL